MSGWYTVASSGGALTAAYPTNWPRGPWRSKLEGVSALNHWVERHRLEFLWGTIQEAHDIQIVGPFRSRAVAREVDISNYHEHIWRP